MPTVLAGFEEDYYTAPMIKPGSYAIYRIYYHPRVEEVRLTVLEADNASLKLELVIVDMKHDMFRTTLLYNIAEGQHLNIGDGYGMPYPFISSGLQKRDFVSLTERRLSGLTVQRIGGEVWNYSFRKVFYYEDPYTMFSWDGESGVLLRYQRINYPPIYIELQSTNLWLRPFDQLPHPSAVAMSAVGIIFTHWEVWLIVVSLIILKLVWRWVVNFIYAVRDVRRNVEMERMIRLIYDQRNRVRIIK
ncbi:MAG: hypothetical protein QXF26_02345 [Candidatus Bathyarchaeia archaeon]